MSKITKTINDLLIAHQIKPKKKEEKEKKDTSKIVVNTDQPFPFEGTNKELLAKIKEMYPIGTVVNCVYGNSKKVTVNQYLQFSHDEPFGVWTENKCWLYLNDTGWAKIVK